MREEEGAKVRAMELKSGTGLVNTLALVENIEYIPTVKFFLTRKSYDLLLSGQ